MVNPNVRLPKGSRILVTGATGLIGGGIADELLRQGYKVHGATRDTHKAQPLADKFRKLYGEDAFTVVEIQDLTTTDSWIKALQDVDGVIHCSTDNSMSSEVDKVVNSTKNTTVGLMEAAAQSPNVKAVVLTSTRIAVYHVQYGKDLEIALDQFADFFYDLAKEASPDDPLKGVMTYAAAKTISERSAWDFFKSQKPHYSFNVVLPDLTFGPIVNPTPSAWSSVGILKQLFDGQEGPLLIENVANPAAYMSDVRDVAVIHVAGLLASDVNGQRLWAVNHQWHLNDVLQVWREAFPDRADTFKEDYDFPPPPKQIIDRSKSTELLQRFASRSWIDFKTTLIDSVKEA